MAVAAVAQLGASSAARGSDSWAIGQRVRNRQPDGGSAGLGRSPPSTIRCARALRDGSGTGAADSSACVYGMGGAREHLLARPGLHDRARGT